MMDENIKKIKGKSLPKMLSEIPEPPKELFLRGELPSEETVMLCVVGSRKYSNYGREVCEKLISGLAGVDIVIVSGLAIGIDSIAHRAALNAGLKTIAVPGSGLANTSIYPAMNFNLAQNILKGGGALLSEFEPNFKATPWSFPKRNRIMAGLCDAVLIIEAEEKSGTLITARLALDYNRNVFVVPSSIFSGSAVGSNRLLRQGATPITCVENLLDELGFDLKRDEYGNAISQHNDCSEEELCVLEILCDPMPREELIRKLEMNISKANILLSTMEIKGLIKENMGEIRKN